jgi:hypothetical protein
VTHLGNFLIGGPLGVREVFIGGMGKQKVARLYDHKLAPIRMVTADADRPLSCSFLLALATVFLPRYSCLLS